MSNSEAMRDRPGDWRVALPAWRDSLGQRLHAVRATLAEEDARDECELVSLREHLARARWRPVLVAKLAALEDEQRRLNVAIEGFVASTTILAIIQRARGFQVVAEVS